MACLRHSAPARLPAGVRALRLGVCSALLGGAWALPALAAPEDNPGPRIYSCIDGRGNRLSSDRPIPECLSKEQRLLNRDGSVRAVVPPARSTEDQMKEEVAQRLKAQESAVRDDAVRRDRMLLIRFPDQKSHDTARQRALAPVVKLIDSAHTRLAKLEAESDTLITKRAALGFKAVPEDLKAQIGINEGAIEAQRNILRKEEAERDRINQQFEAERLRLERLWGGAALGSEAASAATPGTQVSGGRGTVNPR